MDARLSCQLFGPDFVLEPGFTTENVCSDEAASGEGGGFCFANALSISKNGESLSGRWQRIEREISDDELALGVDEHNDAARLGYGNQREGWFSLLWRRCAVGWRRFLAGSLRDFALGIPVEFFHWPCGSGRCAVTGTLIWRLAGGDQCEQCQSTNSGTGKRSAAAKPGPKRSPLI